MRTIQITMKFAITEGATSDAERFARSLMEQASRFSHDAKADYVEFVAKGLSKPMEFRCDLREPVEIATPLLT